jgi:hypothetical protein
MASDKKLRVRRSDGDPRLTVSQQLLEDMANATYERDPAQYDAMIDYHMAHWVLFGTLPKIP